MIAPLAEQEGLNALKLEDIACKAVEQVVQSAAQHLAVVHMVLRLFCFCTRFTVPLDKVVQNVCVSPAVPSSPP